MIGFLLHKQIISPNAAWVLVFNDAAAIYLHWLLNSHATVHWNGCPGHVICIRGTQEQDHSSDLKINSAILYKSRTIRFFWQRVSQWVCLFAPTHSCLSDKARKNTSNENVRSTTSPTSCKILYNIESLPANSSIGWNSMSGYSLVKSAFYQLIEQSLVQISTDNYWPIG